MDVSIRIDRKTYKRIVTVRGKLEHKNGKRRSIKEVINELVDYFESHEGK